MTDTESVVKGALIMPFAPTRGFTALRRQSKLGGAIAVAIILSVAYSLVAHLTEDGLFHGIWSSEPWHVILVQLMLSVLYTLLSLALLVFFSTVFISTRAGGKRDYSTNARLLCYRSAWQFAFALVVVSIPLDDALRFFINVMVMLWFLLLLAVALSVANNVELKRCWLPAIGAVVCTAVISSAAIFLLAPIPVILA